MYNFPRTALHEVGEGRKMSAPTPIPDLSRESLYRPTGVRDSLVFRQSVQNMRAAEMPGGV
jgi:hypothetical protein